MRRRILWLLAAPISLAGSQGAHWLAYRVTTPDAGARGDLLAETGHGYLALAPVAGGIAVALLVAALAVRAAAAARDIRLSATVARWPFALVPPVAFTLQEHIERLVHDGAVPLHAYADRSFVTGLALQLPFALAAYLLARLLLAGADALGRRLTRPVPAHATPRVVRPATRLAAALRPASLDLSRAGRAPPALAAG